MIGDEKMRILVVEDDSGKRDRLIRIFGKNQITDFCIEKFVDNAIERAMSEKFDLLITDIGLPKCANERMIKPGKPGFEMMLRLVEQNIRIPTIIYSIIFLSENEKNILEEKKYPLLSEVSDYVVVEQIIKYLLERKESG